MIHRRKGTTPRRQGRAATTGEPEAATTSAIAPGVLTDVLIEARATRAWRETRRVAVGVIAFIVIGTGAVVLFLGPTPGITCPVFAVLIAAIVLLLYLRRRRAPRAPSIADIIASGTKRPLASVVEDAMCGDVLRLHRVVLALARSGYLGATIRGAPPGRAKPLTPFTLPFEPQPLHEVDSALIAEMAGEACAGAFPASAPPATNKQEPEAVRRVWRWIRMNGTWGGMLIVAIVLLRDVMSWVEGAAVSRLFVSWLALFVVFMLCKFAERLFETEEWLVVPGGAVLRKSTSRGSKWSLHVFDRRRSVLCVYEATGGKHCAIVSDGSETASREMTPNESDFLLRAWLSALVPPPAERMSDLV